MPQVSSLTEFGLHALRNSSTHGPPTLSTADKIELLFIRKHFMVLLFGAPPAQHFQARAACCLPACPAAR